MYTNQIAQLRNSLLGHMPEEAVDAISTFFGNCGMNLEHRGEAIFDKTFENARPVPLDESVGNIAAAVTIRNRLGDIINNEIHNGIALDVEGPLRVNHHHFCFNGIAAAPPRTCRKYTDTDHVTVLTTPTPVGLVSFDPGLSVGENDWEESADTKGLKLPHTGVYAYHITAYAKWDSVGTGPVNLVTALYVGGVKQAETQGTLGAVEESHDGYSNNVQWENATCNLCHSGLFIGDEGDEVKLYSWATSQEPSADANAVKTILVADGTKTLALAIQQINFGN